MSVNVTIWSTWLCYIPVYLYSCIPVRELIDVTQPSASQWESCLEHSAMSVIHCMRPWLAARQLVTLQGHLEVIRSFLHASEQFQRRRRDRWMVVRRWSVWRRAAVSSTRLQSLMMMMIMMTIRVTTCSTVRLIRHHQPHRHQHQPHYQPHHHHHHQQQQQQQQRVMMTAATERSQRPSTASYDLACIHSRPINSFNFTWVSLHHNTKPHPYKVAHQ